VTKEDLGFCEGKPVAAFTLYNCLLHWKSFEAEKTSIFDRLIMLIGSAIEVTYLLFTQFYLIVVFVFS
jgi:hypothetical protein